MTETIDIRRHEPIAQVSPDDELVLDLDQARAPATATTVQKPSSLGVRDSSYYLG